MAGFTLIHGSGQNASGWDAVAGKLRSGGHEVSVPDLPKSRPDWSLADFASFLAKALPSARPLVAVGSSFSGVFLPLLPADVLVFDAAVVPEPGRSVRDQFAADASMFHPDWIASGVRWLDPSQREILAREFLLHDLEDPSQALPSIEMFDTRHLVTEPFPLERLPSAAYASIVAARDRTITPNWQRRMARDRLHVEPIEIDAGHLPHTTRPDQFTLLLEEILARSGV